METEIFSALSPAHAVFILFTLIPSNSSTWREHCETLRDSSTFFPSMPGTCISCDECPIRIPRFQLTGDNMGHGLTKRRDGESTEYDSASTHDDDQS
ncbi:MAG: hypothetical protein ACREBR_01440, partial [bacterium]